MKRILLLLYVSSLLASCKKEKIERDSHHFMTTSSIKTNEFIKLNVEYNTNEKEIIIAGDSIIFRKEGIYHFDGSIYAYVERIVASRPVVYEMYIIVPHLGTGYRLTAGVTAPFTGNTDVGFSEFSFELYLKANAVIKVGKAFTNAAVTSPLIFAQFSGYRKGNQ